MDLTVACGFGFNMEFPHEFHKNGSQKGHLDRWDLIPSGSTGNIGTFLTRFLGAENVQLIVSLEKENTKKSKIAEVVLSSEGLNFTALRILENTPFATYPYRVDPHTLYGDGGIITHSQEIILSEVEKIKNLRSKWRIASGVRSTLLPVLKVFFCEEHDGFRSLCPNPQLFEDSHVMLETLKKSDFLIMNEGEFKKMGISISNLHKMGMEIFVVTKGKNGGTAYLCNSSTRNISLRIDFKAPDVLRDIFSIGAGDWWHAALVGFWIKNGISFKEVDKISFLGAIEFANQVVAKKLLFPGGSVGPSVEEILAIEEKTLGPSAQGLIRYRV